MDITPGKNEAISRKISNNLEAFKHMFDGMRFTFPVYKHDHPPVIDVNEEYDEKITFGQRIADAVATGMGSWAFIITQSLILILWATLNSVGWFAWKWDLYPFIAMNLLLSCQAAYAAPVIMMSQNRQAGKDRLMAENDYHCNVKGEEEIRYIMEHLDHQDTLILQIVKRLEEQHIEMLGHLTRLDPELAKRLETDLQLAKEEMDETTGKLEGDA
ncbi:MAG TPA: DUF1003 domain-containing protein [Ktedonobacteraceae bacterium]|nr:DUF1003 domain-containing protein [Ktedonobacteraceae bacterium]